MLDESAAFNPITAYGQSKVLVEADVSKLADESFSPTYLRNATAYGVVAAPAGRHRRQQPGRGRVHDRRGADSERRHAVAAARAHPGHLARVSRRARGAARGDSQPGVQRREQPRRTTRFATSPPSCRKSCPDAWSSTVEGGGPDPRCYRVSCEKLTKYIPDFRTEWTVRRGAEELYTNFVQAWTDTPRCFRGYVRLARIQELLGDGRLDATLRWQSAVTV